MNNDQKFLNACKSNNIETIKITVEKTTKLTRNQGLSYACELGYKNIVELLIEKGADDWNTGLIFSCRGGHKELSELILNKADNWSNALWDACYGGSMEIIELLLKKGVKSLDWGLYGANYGNHTNIKLMMILKGANINICFLNFEDIYYLLQKGLRNFGNYNNIADKCKKWKLEFSNVSNELFVKDVANLLIEY